VRDQKAQFENMISELNANLTWKDKKIAVVKEELDHCKKIVDSFLNL
jgi:hypothetical protein